jgi:Tol biopolymer transport system component
VESEEADIMKLGKWIAGVALAAVLCALAAAAQSQDKAQVALRAAMEKEKVEGDLKGAIDQYKKLAQGNNRPIAAQALIHLGECYEKLGSKEADKQYELVLSKFADQKDAVAQARGHLGGAAKAKGMVNRPVWESDQAGSAGAVSPDGRYLAFTERSDGRRNLALHDLTTGTDRRLTNAAAGEFPDESAFSPDGKQIAYIWHTAQTSEIRVLSLSGTAPAIPRVFKIADWKYDRVAWSPDQKTLAVYVYKKPEERFQGIMLVSVLDGTSRLLASSGDDDLFFSPDGKYLAYGSIGSTKPSPLDDLFVLPVDGGPEVRVLDWPSYERAIGWSPDGRLLFMSNRSGSSDLWALPIRDGKPQGLAALIKSDIGSPVGLTSSGALYYHVASGGQLAFYQIAPFDFATGRILSPPVTVETAVTSAAGDWSRDGKYFAYIKPAVFAGGLSRTPVVTIRTTETGLSRELGSDCLLRPIALHWAADGHTLAATGTGGLCLIDAQTGQVSKIDVALGPGESLDFQPEWSPDQKKLYFRRLSQRSSAGDRSVAFIEKDLASGNQREIIRRATARELDAWHLSPDGRSIGVVSHDASTKSAAVLLIPAAGGEPKELFRRPEADLWNLAFSPDGKYMVTVGFAATNWTPVLFIPTAGGEAREWLTAEPPRMVTWGMWAPDSRSVLLRKTTMAREQTELWRVSVDGGQAAELDTNASLDHTGVGPFSSPDGSQIAIMRQENTPRKNEIWVLENFLSSIPAK